MTALEQVGHLADVPMSMNIELARRIMTLREILALTLGSVITLPRLAGENIDILIGQVVLASGEIVIIEETVGVRITDFNEED